jgi:hypothetical protein
MRANWFYCSVVVGTLLSSCDGDGGGCGGRTCPFAEPRFHAVVRGVVVDLNDRPLAGIYTRVKAPHEARSGVGTLTDQQGRFTATAQVDVLPPGDTVSAWVRATQANPPPGAVISDSVRVLLQFKPRAEPAAVVETTIRLPVTP